MREEFAREFPGAARALERTWDRVSGPRPILGGEPVVWATISGIGAGFLVGFVVQTVVGLTNETLQALRAPTPFALFPLVTIAGIATAAAVALRAGGPIALALYLAYLVLGIVLGIPGQITSCERFHNLLDAGRDRCTPVGFLISLWPQLVGIGLGAALSRTLTTRGSGVNSLLRIAGALALALFVVSSIWRATIAQTTSASTSALTIAAGTVAAAVAAGAMAAQLPRSIRNAAIVAVISLLPWLTLQLPLGLRSFGPTVSDEIVAAIIVSVAVQPISAVFLVLSAVVAARRRFIPRGAE